MCGGMSETTCRNASDCMFVLFRHTVSKGNKLGKQRVRERK